MPDMENLFPLVTSGSMEERSEYCVASAAEGATDVRKEDEEEFADASREKSVHDLSLSSEEEREGRERERGGRGVRKCGGIS